MGQWHMIKRLINLQAFPNGDDEKDISDKRIAGRLSALRAVPKPRVVSSTLTRGTTF